MSEGEIARATMNLLAIFGPLTWIKYRDNQLQERDRRNNEDTK